MLSSSFVHQDACRKHSQAEMIAFKDSFWKEILFLLFEIAKFNVIWVCKHFSICILTRQTRSIERFGNVIA